MTTDALGRELSGAEVALVSVDSREPLKVSTQGAASLPSSRFLAFPIDVFQPRSGGAYMITRAACERMIKHNVPIRTPADDWGFFYSEGILDRIRCVLPVPAKKNHNFSSTIGSYKLGSGPLGRLMAAAMRHRIPCTASNDGPPTVCYLPRKRLVGVYGRTICWREHTL